MAVKKFVVGCFDEEAVLFDAVKKVRKAGYKLHDVYTPFPIHGLDKAMGLRDTSIHTAVSLCDLRNNHRIELHDLGIYERLAFEYWR